MGVSEVAGQLIRAFNARDVAAVAALLDEDVVLGFGPKVLHGRKEALEFVERQLFGVGVSTTHGRRFVRGHEMVPESRQQLSFVETGEVAAEEQLVPCTSSATGGSFATESFPTSRPRSRQAP